MNPFARLRKAMTPRGFIQRGAAVALPDSPAVLGWSSWGDASDSAYRTLDGASLVEVNDKILSGNNWRCADFPTAAQAPPIDTGTGIVSFNGASHGLRSSHATLIGWFDGASTAETVSFAALVRHRVANADACVVAYSSTAADRRGGMHLHGTPSLYGLSRRAVVLSGGTTDLLWHAWTATVNDTSSSLEIDGATVITGSLNTTAYTPTQISIGYRVNATGDKDFAAMDWTELVLHPGAASAGMRSGVRAYWAAKYGLTT